MHRPGRAPAQSRRRRVALRIGALAGIALMLAGCVVVPVGPYRPWRPYWHPYCYYCR